MYKLWFEMQINKRVWLGIRLKCVFLVIVEVLLNYVQFRISNENKYSNS